MFPVKTYVSRRAELRAKTGGGLILLPGNQPSANNYPNNAYYFRQDSTFLYYFGLDRPSLAGVIDADTGEEVLFGDDFTVDDIIWTGPQPTLREEGARAGVADCRPLAALADYLAAAIRLGRRIHYLPPYRGETKLQLSALLGIAPALLHDYKSVDLMFAVAEMREVIPRQAAVDAPHVQHIGEYDGALDVFQECMSETDVVMRSLDQSRNIGDGQPRIIRVFDHADHRMKRGKRIRRYFGARRRNRAQQRGFPGIRISHQADIGDGFEFEIQLALLARFARLPFARRAVGVGRETGIAPAAPAAARILRVASVA